MAIIVKHILKDDAGNSIGEYDSIEDMRSAYPDTSFIRTAIEHIDNKKPVPSIFIHVYKVYSKKMEAINNENN